MSQPVQAARPGPLTPAQVRQWHEEGYLLLRGVVPQAIIQALRDVFAARVEEQLQTLKKEGVIQDTRPDLPFETRFSEAAGTHANRFGRSWRRAISSEALYHLHHVTGIADSLWQLMGGELLGHPVWNARPKLPGQQLTVVPWHQDSGYFGKESETSRIVTVWLPLVPVTAANGAIQVLPGSHRRGLVKHRTETREGGFLEVDVDVDESPAVTCDMGAGDVLMFGNLLFHRSLPGNAPPIRWSIDIRYYPAGDHPGTIYWPDPAFEWVIRSERRAPTSLPGWLPHANSLPW